MYSSRQPLRLVEVYFSSVMTLGGVFVVSDDALSFPQYHFLKSWVDVFPGSTFRFGLLLLIVGIARLVAIVVNGRYIRGRQYPTPLFRSVGCLIGAALWVTLTLALTRGSGFPAFVAFTFLAAPFEIYCSMRSAADAAKMDIFGSRARKRSCDGHSAPPTH